MLTVFASGAAITIANGNRDGGAVDDRDGVRQRASRRLLRRLLRRKIASRYGTLTTDGSQGLPDDIYGRGFNAE